MPSPARISCKGGFGVWLAAAAAGAGASFLPENSAFRSRGRKGKGGGGEEKNTFPPRIISSLATRRAAMADAVW